MKTKFLHIILCFSFVLGLGTSLDLYATHMVGGEINYRCLGNDQYEIMVTVFRDCDTGVPWFDNPASVGVFDVNNNLVYDLRLTLRNNDTLDLNLTDPCLVAPPNVCIHTTTYLDTVTLPFLAGGYQIVYQRCCRNQDIVNIVNPTGTGATYSSFISEQALLVCNSSARFIEWPPVYICAGVPLNYNHAAFDVDGDSIVYELCAPYTGATPNDPMPQPPYNPPYTPVTWLPPYSVDNMLGGPDSFKINSSTGLVTGTPDNLGVFVVGVCAKEYRNGILISTTRRDFQYVVGICGRLVSAAFFAPEIQCDNSLIVNFQNNSTTLGTGFIWTFGDTSTNATSTYSTPTYIYPDTGRYTITLIADPGSLCADTSVQEIYLQYESISADFNITTASCTDSFFLDITDLTIDSISTIAVWNWDFGNGETDTIPYPSTVYTSSGTYIITLNVEAANGCTAYYTDTIDLNLPTIFSADTIAICAGDTSIILNPGGDPTHQYTWSPATNLSSTSTASPIASPNSNTVYFVTVVVPNGIDTCILERSITVVLAPPITLDVARDTITCQNLITITATSPTAQSIEWSTDPNFGIVQFVGTTVQLPVTGATRFFVRATNAEGCSVIDTIDVFKRFTPIVINWTHQVVVCDTAYIVQFTDLTTDLSGGAITSWLWNFGDGTNSNLQNPSHAYAQSGNYFASLFVTTVDGCTGFRSALVSVLRPQITSGDTVGICQGNSSVTLNPNGNSALQYQWSPAATLSSATAVSPVATPLIPTTYTVTITAVNGTDTCIYIDQVHVNFPPPVTVTIAAVTVYCGNTVTLTASSPTGVTFQWSGDPSFTTIIGTGNPFVTTPTTTPFAGYYVRATDAYGCRATAFALVQQNPTPIVADFSYQSLGCSNTMNIQFTDMTLDTAVSPISSWLWATSDGQSSTLQNPVFTFAQSPVTVTLSVTLANGCSNTISKIITFNLAVITSSSTINLCNGVSSTKLNSGGNPSLQYQWSPAASLSSATAVEPVATPPSFPFTYTVTVTAYNSIDTCISIRTVTIQRAPPIVITVPKDTITCEGVFYIQASVSNAAQIDWSFSSNFNPVAIANVTNFYVGMPPPPYDLYLYIRVTDAYGCVATDTAIVYRRDIPIPVSFVPTIHSCEDTLNVSFANTSNFPSNLQLQGYNWSYGNGTTGTTFNGAAQYTSGSSHTIQLTATSTNGCIGTAIQTLNYTLPTINSRDSIGLCGADSVKLNVGGNPALLYQWSPATGLSDPTIASPLAGPSSNTSYTVTVTAPNGGDTCRQVRTIVIGVDSFLFEAMPDTVICFNQIGLTVNSPTASFVEWALDRNFNLIIGTGSPLVTNVNDKRWFYVRGLSAFGCVAMDSVYVQYRGNDIPVNFTMSPLNCGDSLLVAFQEISGDTTITSWNWNFGNGQTSTLQNPTTTFYADSVYLIDLQIKIIGNCNGQIQKPLRAQIPSLSVPNNIITICEGDSTPLIIQTKPNLTYVWTPNLNLSDSSSAAPMVTPTTSTTYHVRVYGYSSFGGVLDTCWLEDSIRVVLQPFPTLQLQGDSTICDSLVEMSAASAQSTTFEWATTNNFGVIINNNANLQTSMAVGSQWYYVRVQDSLGCATVDSALARSLVVAIDLNSTTICLGESTQLAVQNNNPSDTLIYTWYPNNIITNGQGTDTVTVAPNTTVSLTVLGVNAFGCVDSAQAFVNLAPPLDVTVPLDTTLCQPNLTIAATSSQALAQYTWSDNANFTTVLGQNSTLNTSASNNLQTYYVQVVDSFGCIKIDSIEIGYYPASLQVDSVPLLCVLDTVQLFATNLNPLDNLSYQWSPTTGVLAGQGTNSLTVLPLGTTTYQVIGQNQYGCTATAQMIVGLAPALTLQVPLDTILCSPSLLITASSNQLVQYTWSNDASFNNVLGQNSTLQTNAGSNQNVYYIQIVDDYGCTKMDSVKVGYFPVQIAVDSASLMCRIEPVQLVASNLGLEVLTYQWSPSNAIITGQGTDTVLVNPAISTNFTVIGENQYGCSAIISTNVAILSTNPTVLITTTDDTVSLGQSTQLLATVQNGYSYQWAVNPTLIGDTIYNPMATPLETTTYYLTVTDVFGCVATDSIIIYTASLLCDEPNVFVPNAFTPDGDGHNDIIFVEGAAITDVYFVIYNRWGEQVFQSNDKSIGWDGKFKGKDCPPDVYGYFMKCKCLDGNELTKKGNITLLK